jgi:hypothetical protein
MIAEGKVPPVLKMPPWTGLFSIPSSEITFPLVAPLVPVLIVLLESFSSGSGTTLSKLASTSTGALVVSATVAILSLPAKAFRKKGSKKRQKHLSPLTY